ncbi:hypothetical protein ACFE04_023505 [Oxalis oulophora]
MTECVSDVVAECVSVWDVAECVIGVVAECVLALRQRGGLVWAGGDFGDKSVAFTDSLPSFWSKVPYDQPTTTSVDLVEDERQENDFAEVKANKKIGDKGIYLEKKFKLSGQRLSNLAKKKRKRKFSSFGVLEFPSGAGEVRALFPMIVNVGLGGIAVVWATRILGGGVGS